VSRRRRFAVAGVVAGGLVASTAAVLAAQRQLASRIRHVPDPDAREPFGSLHSRGRVVLADDGVPLHVEELGDPAARPTVVFVHGFSLSMDSWHYQRRDLPDVGRLVFYDQRSHGASGRGSKEHATLDQLGRDLFSVLLSTAPEGPVVLIGHSLGGMTIMALAEQHPEMFGRRIVGVALLSTASGQIADTVFGLPRRAGRVLKIAAPVVVPRLASRSALLERGRSVSGDLSFLVTRWFAFGRHASPSLVAFLERMLAATPIDVILEFLPTFLDHDRVGALAALRGVETLILTGARDTLITPDHSQAIAEVLPDAELVQLADAGHMVTLERPALVNLHLRAFIRRAGRARRRRAASA